MQVSSPTRRNHMGRRWMPPLWSSVARFAMSVIEKSLSISARRRTRGLFAALGSGLSYLFPSREGFSVKKPYTAIAILNDGSGPTHQYYGITIIMIIMCFFELEKQAIY
jgi:hypothetical protein